MGTWPAHIPKLVGTRVPWEGGAPPWPRQFRLLTQPGRHIIQPTYSEHRHYIVQAQSGQAA
eukprot:3299455-Pleurochrysis_carterae.AAC.1